MKKAAILTANVYDSLKLSEKTGLLRSAVRREMLFAESAGVISCSLIGRSRVLSVEQLEAFLAWLTRRGLLAADDAAPASA